VPSCCIGIRHPNKDISFYINSPGGVVSSGLAIYDTMQYIRSPVSTVCNRRRPRWAACCWRRRQGQALRAAECAHHGAPAVGGAQGQATISKSRRVRSGAAEAPERDLRPPHRPGLDVIERRWSATAICPPRKRGISAWWMRWWQTARSRSRSSRRVAGPHCYHVGARMIDRSALPQRHGRPPPSLGQAPVASAPCVCCCKGKAWMPGLRPA